jgi:hypothetical protein
MVATILERPSRNFAGVNYNTSKVDRNKGELMLAANFGPLQALSNLRPQDYTNYLMMLAGQNKRTRNTQFHAVISARGRNYNKDELTQAAVLWLKEMGYGEQPYLIVFHKDTENNHVHAVTSRIDRNGAKISSAFEQIRAVRNIDKVLGYTAALQYSFSTKAQFYMILENLGSLGRDYMYDDRLKKKVDGYVPDRQRIAELKTLFTARRSGPDFLSMLKYQYGIDLVFHSSEGKKPYGYTILDHATKQVFKGSEVLSLKYLFEQDLHEQQSDNRSFQRDTTMQTYMPVASDADHIPEPAYIGPVRIADDVDDQQVLGMKRRRQKKARTNTR